VKDAIEYLKYEGTEEHAGSKIDLASILERVIRNYERRGIEWCVDRYWKASENHLIRGKMNMLIGQLYLYQNEKHGEITLDDIIGEMEKILG
jgi:hypothetical protein